MRVRWWLFSLVLTCVVITVALQEWYAFARNDVFLEIHPRAWEESDSLRGQEECSCVQQMTRIHPFLEELRNVTISHGIGRWNGPTLWASDSVRQGALAWDVWNRLHYLQNPSREACESVRFLVVPMPTVAGLFSLVHTLAFMLNVALALNRTLVIEWNDNQPCAYHGLGCVLPNLGRPPLCFPTTEEIANAPLVSHEEDPSTRVVRAKDRNVWFIKGGSSAYKGGIPYPALNHLSTWSNNRYHSLLIGFLLRPSHQWAARVYTIAKKWNLWESTPCTSIHIRHGDKSAMLKGYGISMELEFERFQDAAERVEKRVLPCFTSSAWGLPCSSVPSGGGPWVLATDDQVMVKQAQRMAKNRTVGILDMERAHGPTSTPQYGRLPSFSIRWHPLNVLMDFSLMSQCPRFVGTLTSNLGRAQAQLRMFLVDGREKTLEESFVSLDWSLRDHYVEWADGSGGTTPVRHIHER